MKDWETPHFTEMPSGLIIEEDQIKKAEHAISLALKMVLEDEAQTYEVIQYVLDKYIERLKSKKLAYCDCVTITERNIKWKIGSHHIS